MNQIDYKIRPIKPKHIRSIEDFGGKIIPLEPLGAKVYGIDLSVKNRLTADVINALEEEMAYRGFVVFKNQVDLSIDDFLNACCLWGGHELHSTHGVHPATPGQNRHIFRLSNDPRHGVCGVGPQWHNDGSFISATFSHAGYHIIRPAEHGGGTHFAHQGAAYDALTEEQQEFWSRLSSVNSSSGVVHPVVHEHPVSGRKSVWLHLGMTAAVIEKRPDNDQFRLLQEDEMRSFFNQYNDLLTDGMKNGYALNYEYQDKDCVITDNLAVAHRAAPEAHMSPDQQGLRIMHRATVRGVQDLAPDFELPQQLDVRAHNTFGEGVWVMGGIGFRWDKDIAMQN
ncbi:MAG: taurine dioxygenase [Desulfuromonas sp.]|nr:MAG: taurine dioxygenase [Desulfuromonas sp.]